jgi:hypothetical protein
MAQRPQGCKSTVMTADGIVTSAVMKNVYSLVIGAKGATEGDVIVLRDGGATGTIRAYIVVATDNDTQVVDFGRYGICFAGAIYYSEQATAPLKIRTTVIWD